ASSLAPVHTLVKTLARSFLLSLVVALSGCASNMNTAYETLKFVVSKDPNASAVRLDPRLRYLRITIDGRSALFTLGYLDPHPQGTIEVWYSALREVLRMQNGRLVGAAGAATEWRNVALPGLPAWSALAAAEGPSRWVRVRDVMPGYRYGVRDPLVLRVTPPPSRSALQELDPAGLTWFEEGLDPDAPGGAEANFLPTARYAVQFANGMETVVYGEQCLARDFCFTWQRWPPVQPVTSKAQ
ncbi:MAG: hypothetical protein WCO67_23460, partial [Betaproteobacteria bacterium]